MSHMAIAQETSSWTSTCLARKAWARRLAPYGTRRECAARQAKNARHIQKCPPEQLLFIQDLKSFCTNGHGPSPCKVFVSCFGQMNKISKETQAQDKPLLRTPREKGNKTFFFQACNENNIQVTFHFQSIPVPGFI